jgi:hypothetical protein
MANPVDPTNPPGASEQKKIQRARNNQTHDEREGDSRFLPVVILAGIALIIILIGAIMLIRGKGNKIVPQSQNNHPYSSLVMRVTAAG